jgi:DNA-binding NarL/FixJ family response regulator
LLARRFTNREIAAELVLSVRTVERHIANLYEKTGLSSRRDALSYAHRQDLIPRNT